ncbi:MAG: alpha/beta hydrolase [Lacunisphaera sp.]|nr:alpha/beta hydrolase [Lacunisphaera sp.]
MLRLLLLLFALVTAIGARAAEVDAPPPTQADIPYGPHERHRLDLWLPATQTPAPLVVYIHGGCFTEGDKASAREQKLIQQCLDAGVAYAAVNYRYLAPGVPIQAILRDCARAIQFLRSQAPGWKLDPARVAAYGSSAGAGTSLWLAFHDDLADPKNADPVLRESTRVTCAVALSTQASYNFVRWVEIFGAETVSRYGQSYQSPGLYGFASRGDLLGAAGQAVLADCDMLALLSPDDPPVFLQNRRPAGDVTNHGHFLHHPRHAQLVYDRARELGVTVIADLPDYGTSPPPGGPGTVRDFLFKQLRVTRP